MKNKSEKVYKPPKYPLQDVIDDNPELLYTHSPLSWKTKTLIAGTMLALLSGGCAEHKGNNTADINNALSPAQSITSQKGIGYTSTDTPPIPVKSIEPQYRRKTSRDPFDNSVGGARNTPTMGTPNPQWIVGVVTPSNYPTENDAAELIRKESRIKGIIQEEFLRQNIKIDVIGATPKELLLTDQQGGTSTIRTAKITLDGYSSTDKVGYEFLTRNDEKEKAELALIESSAASVKSIDGSGIKLIKAGDIKILVIQDSAGEFNGDSGRDKIRQAVRKAVTLIKEENPGNS